MVSLTKIKNFVWLESEIVFISDLFPTRWRLTAFWTCCPEHKVGSAENYASGRAASEELAPELKCSYWCKVLSNFSQIHCFCAILKKNCFTTSLQVLRLQPSSSWF